MTTKERMKAAVEEERERIAIAQEQRHIVEIEAERVRFALAAIAKEEQHSSLLSTRKVTRKDEIEVASALKSAVLSVLEQIPADTESSALIKERQAHEEQVHELVAEANEYDPTTSGQTALPFEPSEVAIELEQAAQLGVSIELIQKATHAVTQALHRRDVAMGHTHTDDEGFDALDFAALRNDPQSLQDVTVTWHGQAGTIKADAVRFRITDTYTFGDLISDASFYWDIQIAQSSLNVWQPNSKVVFEGTQIVREAVANLSGDGGRRLELRVYDVSPSAETEAIIPVSQEEYERRKQTTAKVTARQRADYLEDVLYKRYKRRWQNKVLLRASLHYIYTLMLLIMLCLDPYRGYYTVILACCPTLGMPV